MKKILVIEDSRDSRENIVELLEMANYTVLAAENGRKGIQMAREHAPDIILCDIMMPEANGYTVLEVLHHDPKTEHIPFIFLTAKDRKEDLRMGMNLGADDYIFKPFEVDDLLMAISMRLRKSAFMQQEFPKTPAGINAFFEEASDYLGMDTILKNREPIVFQDREHVYLEGGAAHNLYFLEKGNVKTFRGTEEGKEIVTGLYGAGDFFGQLSLLSKSGTFLETAMAIEEAHVLGIPKSDFMKLVYEDREIAHKFLDIISNDMALLEGKLLDIAYSSVDRRAAKALLELHEKGILKDELHKGLDFHRDDFASMIGVAKETAIRTLTKFREIGLLDMDNRRKLIILDKNRLQRIADFEGMV